MTDTPRRMDAHDVDALRRRARALRRAIPGRYDDLRALARGFQLDAVTPDALARAMIECSRASSDAAREIDALARALPSEAHRARLRRALGGGVETMGTTGCSSETRRAREVKAETLAPGLVCLRKFMTVERQRWLADESFRLGESVDVQQGFFERSSDGAAKLNQGSRGRMILTPEAFPGDALREMCAEAVRAAQKVDDAMPDMNPTTCLVNFYKDGAEFKWHKDSEDPKLVKSRAGPPIVSFSVGMSADFGYKYSFEDPTHEVVRLNSGDVLLFGGPSRMIVHSVLNVHPGSMPGHLRGKMLNGRLNVTVRDIGEGVIDTSQFPAYRVSYDGVPAEGNV